jgi:Tfp pilus assembly protein PilV
VKHRYYNIAFSLVEVVIAIGVISFALVAIIGILPVGLASSRQSAQETRANHLAEEIFSTLRSQPFTSASLSSLGTNTTVDLSSQNGTLASPLYASYDGQFVATPDYFTIRLQFTNSPDGMVQGTASEVSVQISERNTSSPTMDYASVIAAH